MKNKLHLSKLACAVALFGLTGFFTTANATTLASWDEFAGLDASRAPDQLLTDFSVAVSQSGVGAVNNGSNDGTFGTAFSGALTTSTRSLGLNSADTITFALTNSSGTDYVIDSFHFDYERRVNSNDGMLVEFTKGAETVTIGNFTDIAFNGYTTSDTLYDFGDFDITDLSAATDVTIASGETVSFTLSVFNDAAGNTSTNSTNPLDNILISGSVVPEPSSFALIAGMFGLTWVMLRRRS